MLAEEKTSQLLAWCVCKFSSGLGIISEVRGETKPEYCNYRPSISSHHDEDTLGGYNYILAFNRTYNEL